MIWIGTSGFQYPEWKGIFYPSDLAAKKMLVYYAGRFRTAEINYSFYRTPSVQTVSNWATETPAQFRFALKAPQQITHRKRLQDCDDALAHFWNVAKTLKKKLGVVLFQLPPFFKKDIVVLKDFLASLPRGMRGAFEFRNADWFDDDVYAALRAKNVALCIADSEKIATPIVATADWSYFRLRDEGYAKKEITRWAGIISQQNKKAKDTYVYFKHEETGSGPKFAAQLMTALGMRTKDLIRKSS